MDTLLLILGAVASIISFILGYVVATVHSANDSIENYYHGYRQGIEAGFYTNDAYTEHHAPTCDSGPHHPGPCR